jgi:hypothetical protein
MSRLNKKLYSISESAKYLGISPVTLRRWHNNGSFRATFVSPGGHRYYSLADLEKMTRGIFQIAQEWASSEIPFEPAGEFYASTSDRFKTRQGRMDTEMNAAPKPEKNISLISASVGEIGNNSFDHNLGNWPDIPGVFFAYDLGKRVVVLADRGIGVLETLKRIRPGLKDHSEALLTAFTGILTARAPEHRGNGLKFVKEALTIAGASLTFQSGDAVVEIKRSKPELTVKKTDSFIRGSLALIKF